MYGIFIFVHVLVCIGLMLSVLMQSAKGEGLAGAFGGSALTGTVFGGRGAAPFLAKATSILAVAFFLSCILLTFMSPSTQIAVSQGQQSESAVEKAAREQQGQQPGQQPGQVPGTVPGDQQLPPAQSGEQQASPPPASQEAPSGTQTPPSGGQNQPGGQ